MKTVLLHYLLYYAYCLIKKNRGLLAVLAVDIKLTFHLSYPRSPSPPPEEISYYLASTE